MKFSGKQVEYSFSVRQSCFNKNIYERYSCQPIDFFQSHGNITWIRKKDFKELCFFFCLEKYLILFDLNNPKKIGNYQDECEIIINISKLYRTRSIFFSIQCVVETKAWRHSTPPFDEKTCVSFRKHSCFQTLESFAVIG